jgi:outer membrane protein assembly factor BamB
MQKTAVFMTRRAAWPKAGNFFLAAGLLGSFCLFFALSSPAAGQIVRGEPDAEEEVPDHVFPTANRDLARRLRAANEYLAKENYGDAARLLGELLEQLDHSDDVFIESPENSKDFKSLKHHLEGLIRSIPIAGQEIVHDLFEPTAQRRLQAAIAQGDAESLAEVARIFGFTTSGREATLLLARRALDLGEPNHAVRLLTRLKQSQSDFAEPMLSMWLACAQRDAGQSDTAKNTLLAARRDYPRPTEKLREREWTWFGSENEALSWLAFQLGEALPEPVRESAAWLLPRGDVSNHGLAKTSLPMLSPRWKQSLFLDDPHSLQQPPFAEIVRQNENRMRENRVVAFSARSALVLPGQVLVRLFGGSLRAFDVSSGKLVWAYPSTVVVDGQLGSGGGISPVELTRRTWEDLSSSQFTSDGSAVFLVESREHVAAQQRRPRGGFTFASRSPFAFTEGNFLTAIDGKRQGKLLWRVPNESAKDAELTGLEFLGPPLPVGEKLYVLSETKEGEIRLLALAKATGKLLWSQTVAALSNVGEGESLRKIAGLTPVAADGVILCPTAAGVLVAVDEQLHTLLWGYDYHGVTGGMPRISMGVAPADSRPNLLDGINNPGWLENALVVTGNKVAFTPIEGDHLHCLDILTGKPIWSPRVRESKIAQLACVEKNKIVLVGSQKVQALDIATGREAWKCDLASGGVPVGRGITTADKLFLPLSSGAVWQIDLQSGAAEGVARARGGALLGNLVAGGEVIVSVGSRTIERFTELAAVQRSTLERLAAQPNDPQALLTSAEVSREKEDYAAALTTLRKSLGLAPDKLRPVVQRTYVETSLDALEFDFTRYRADVEPLADQMVTTSQKARYLRSMAIGLEQQGARLDSIRAALALSDLPGEENQEDGEASASSMYIRGGSHWQIHRQRWTLARISDLRESGKATERAQLESLLAERFAAATAASEPDKLRRFLAVVPFPEWTSRAQLALAERLTDARDAAEREWLWRWLTKSGDAKAIRRAQVGLAHLYAQVGAIPAAVAAYRKLATDFAADECLPGITGKQLVEQLAEGELRSAVLAPPIVAPRGQTEYRVDRKHVASMVEPLWEIPMRGPAGALLEGGSLQVGSRQGMLVGYDANGGESFRVELRSDGSNDEEGFFLGSGMQHDETMARMTHAEVSGQLVVLWQGNQGSRVSGLSALRPLGEDPATGMRHVPLWTCDLATDATPAQHIVKPVSEPLEWGETSHFAMDEAGNDVGSLGPITARGVCVQTRGGELLCLDPLTGQKLWRQKGIPSGCELIGDDEVLVALWPKVSNEATVVRMLDGKILENQIPGSPRRRRMLAAGRQIVERYNNAGVENSIRLFDPFAKKVIWSRPVTEKFRATFLGQELLVLLEMPSRAKEGGDKQPNRISVLRVSDGTPLVDKVPLAPETQDVKRIAATRHGEFLAILTALPGSPNRVDVPLAIPRWEDRGVTGSFWGLSLAEGKKVWGPVAIKDLSFWRGQATGSPILALLATDQPSRNDATSQGRLLAALCIDKRTGRIAYQTRGKESIPALVNNFLWQYVPSQATVLLTLPRHVVGIHLTDAPLVAEESPAAQQGVVATDWKIPNEIVRVGEEDSGNGEINPFDENPE